MVRLFRHTFLFIFVCVPLVLTGCSPSGTQVTAPRVGEAAPPFTLPLLDGGKISLADQKGKVVIVNFWASWCGPCLAETPRLAEWYNKYHLDGLNILGINVLARDSRATVMSFVKDKQVAYPIPLDESGTVTAQWLAQQLPRSYVIDRDGVVRFVRIGELTDGDLTSQILPLLEQSSSNHHKVYAHVAAPGCTI